MDKYIHLLHDNHLYNLIRLLINKLVAPFQTSSEIVLVAANHQPIAPSTFVGKISTANSLWWYETRKDWNRGVNIHNISGQVMAVRSSFAQSMKFPKKTAADEKYIFLTTIKRKKQFAFVDSAKFYYRTPATFKDYYQQSKRFFTEANNNSAANKLLIDTLEVVPFGYRFKALINSLIRSPFYTVLFLICHFLFAYLSRKERQVEYRWQPVQSTKLAYE